MAHAVLIPSLFPFLILQEVERARKEREIAFNQLEAFIFRVQERLTEEDVEKVSTGETVSKGKDRDYVYILEPQVANPFHPWTA